MDSFCKIAIVVILYGVGASLFSTPSFGQAITRICVQSINPTNGNLSCTDASATWPFPVAPSASSSGGVSTYSAVDGTSNALLTNSAISVKASAGTLYGADFYNGSNADAYIQVFDVAAASVTLGTTVPKLSLHVPVAGWLRFAPAAMGVGFVNAISVAATTTATGSTAPSAGIQANGIYFQ